MSPRPKTHNAPRDSRTGKREFADQSQVNRPDQAVLETPTGRQAHDPEDVAPDSLEDDEATAIDISAQPMSEVTGQTDEGTMLFRSADDGDEDEVRREAEMHPLEGPFEEEEEDAEEPEEGKK